MPDATRHITFAGLRHGLPSLGCGVVVTGDRQKLGAYAGPGRRHLVSDFCKARIDIRPRELEIIMRIHIGTSNGVTPVAFYDDLIHKMGHPVARSNVDVGMNHDDGALRKRSRTVTGSRARKSLRP